MSVEIFTVQESLILRARGSELLILPHHAKKLNGLKVPKDFCAYFMNEALVNRPARKLFEAWLRKDVSLWKRIFQKIQTEMEFAAEAAAIEGEAVEAAASTEVKTAKPTKKTESVVAVEEKTSKVVAKKKPKADTLEAEGDEKVAVKKKATTKASPEKSAAPKTAAKPVAEKSAAKAPAKKSSATAAPKAAKKK